jgi:hypothetical protein
MAASRSETFNPYSAYPRSYVPYSGSAPVRPSSPPYAPSEQSSSEVEVGETRTFDQLYEEKLKEATQDGSLIVIEDDESDAKRAKA